MERWNDTEIVKFLDLFQLQPCLWNADLPQYRSPDRRSEAIRWIIERLGCRMTEMEIRLKIKNIRTTYVKCLKRVLRAEELGLAADYIPSLVWFKRADVFLRTHSERTLLKKKQKKNPIPNRSHNQNELVMTIKSEHGSDTDQEIAAVETECEDEESRTINEHSNDEHSNKSLNKNPTHDSSKQKLDIIETSESDDDDDKVPETKFGLGKPDKLVPYSSATLSVSKLHFEQHEEGSPNISRRFEHQQECSSNANRHIEHPEEGSSNASHHFEHQQEGSSNARRNLEHQQEGASRHFEYQQQERSSKDKQFNSSSIPSLRRRYNPYADHGRHSPDVHRARHSHEAHRYSEEVLQLSNYSAEDEIDVFTRHVGNQLRQLPLGRALRCQDAIHSLLMKERIEHCQELDGSKTNLTNGLSRQEAMAKPTNDS